jgi:hypothetical protein
MAARRGPVLCALATYRGPHAVLLTREAARCPCASEGQVRGRGSTPHLSGTLAASPGAGVGGQSIAQGQAKGPRCSWACADAGRPHGSALAPGASSGAPVRPQARRLPALTWGGTSPYRRPSLVCAYPRPRGPPAAPARAGPSPGRVALPVGSGPSAPRDAPAGRGPRPASRPPCERPAPSSCRLARSAGQQMPAPPCPGGKRRRNPARAGTARSHRLPTAGPDGAFCRSRARAGAETGSGRRAAWRM